MTPGSRISAVSYLNTVPMVYGIERAGLLRAELLLSPPSGCAEAFASGRADVALLPSAALLEIPEHNIITSFCIGAVGDVRTVVIVGDSPISNVRRLFLDSHSLTSVALSAILCRELWRIEPERIDMSDLSPLDNARTGDAFLLIGDKVFDHEGRFGYSYDLARAWRELTGLPFVFALWVASPDTQGATTAALEGSLCYGVEHIAEAVAASPHCDKPYAVDYLTRNIDYNLDEAKRRSLELFLHKCKDGYSAPQNVTL